MIFGTGNFYGFRRDLIFYVYFLQWAIESLLDCGTTLAYGKEIPTGNPHGAYFYVDEREQQVTHLCGGTRWDWYLIPGTVCLFWFTCAFIYLFTVRGYKPVGPSACALLVHFGKTMWWPAMPIDLFFLSGMSLAIWPAQPVVPALRSFFDFLHRLRAPSARSYWYRLLALVRYTGAWYYWRIRSEKFSILILRVKHFDFPEPADRSSLITTVGPQ